MARSSVSPSHRLPQPGKLAVYQQQASINLALENVVLGCQQLEPLNIIPRGFLIHYANMAEELRSLINRRILEDMAPIENRDAKRLQDERLKWESRPGSAYDEGFKTMRPNQRKKSR